MRVSHSVASRPVQITAAAGLVAVQAGGLLLLAGLALLDVDGRAVEVGVSVGVFFVLSGGALLACAVGLIRLQGWSRGPVLITQLIQLGIAWNVRDLPVLAVALAVVALATLALMVQPASVDALSGVEGEHD